MMCDLSGATESRESIGSVADADATPLLHRRVDDVHAFGLVRTYVRRKTSVERVCALGLCKPRAKRVTEE